MSEFVEECRKEWSRIGVSGNLANEMAADLEADLAEAQADGVSPEEVLGNGIFDPAAFAASWAVARGIVGAGPQTTTANQHRTWALAAAALVSAAAAMVGLLILVVRPMGSVSVAAAAFPRRLVRPIPGIFITPQRIFAEHSNNVLALLGVALFVAALIGLGITFWLWRSWSTRRRRSGFDDDLGMPSYL
jgi:hypothetical protein